ncbi:MAG: hypothetical protein ACI8ZM_002810 [Crocinitomix sp.]|jgi:hypothetical protein
MKNLLLIITIVFGGLTASAQPPSVKAQLINKTSCPIYVKLMLTNSSCGVSLTTVYAIPPHSSLLSAAPPAGYWYDAALVDNSATFTGTLYTKVRQPWAVCTGYYNVTETGTTSCTPPVATVTWSYGTSSAAPVLIIYD